MKAILFVVCLLLCLLNSNAILKTRHSNAVLKTRHRAVTLTTAVTLGTKSFTSLTSTQSKLLMTKLTTDGSSEALYTKLTTTGAVNVDEVFDGPVSHDQKVRLAKIKIKDSLEVAVRSTLGKTVTFASYAALKTALEDEVYAKLLVVWKPTPEQIALSKWGLKKVSLTVDNSVYAGLGDQGEGPTLGIEYECSGIVAKITNHGAAFQSGTDIYHEGTWLQYTTDESIGTFSNKFNEKSPIEVKTYPIPFNNDHKDELKEALDELKAFVVYFNKLKKTDYTGSTLTQHYAGVANFGWPQGAPTDQITLEQESESNPCTCYAQVTFSLPISRFLGLAGNSAVAKSLITGYSTAASVDGLFAHFTASTYNENDKTKNDLNMRCTVGKLAKMFDTGVHTGVAAFKNKPKYPEARQFKFTEFAPMKGKNFFGENELIVLMELRHKYTEGGNPLIKYINDYIAISGGDAAEKEAALITKIANFGTKYLDFTDV